MGAAGQKKEICVALAVIEPVNRMSGAEALVERYGTVLKFDTGKESMPLMRLVLPSAVLATGFLASMSSIYATSEYGKKEKKSCTFCHTKVTKNKTEMTKNLKSVGTCYKDNAHSLVNCAPSK
jgi:hypothetical protein